MLRLDRLLEWFHAVGTPGGIAPGLARATRCPRYKTLDHALASLYAQDLRSWRPTATLLLRAPGPYCTKGAPTTNAAGSHFSLSLYFAVSKKITSPSAGAPAKGRLYLAQAPGAQYSCACPLAHAPATGAGLQRRVPEDGTRPSLHTTSTPRHPSDAPAAARMSSVARSTPPAERSRSAQALAAASMSGRPQTSVRAWPTSARYASTASRSVPASGSGLSTFRPTPRATALAAFTIWSPAPGHTTTGVPCERDSVKLFCPPCVRKRSTPTLRRSTCGSTGAQIAFEGATSSPRGSAWGPRATTSSGPAPAVSAPAETPKASKAPAHAPRHNSRPVRPRG
mmetsp:Transcript_142886/g.356070  ORF Transcript_142886/g.356070 Transcript_142886/m.356070 type:complete len:339 (-) Transcript_142886:1023-2039(-)